VGQIKKPYKTRLDNRYWMGQMKDKLKISVGTSTKKNSYEAGKELAETIIKEIKEVPDLILLFSTLDYKNHGGLENILKGVLDVLPEKTKLAGGTVPGFVNKKGCYASGVTVMALKYPNMNISIGIGKNTKRSPKKAAKQTINQIKSNLKNEYNNNFIISIISGARNPDLPGVKNTNIINSKVKAKIMLPMFTFFQKTAQKGFGKEQEILEEIIKELPNFNIIHSSSYSSAPSYENYQFYNDKVLTEHAVIVAIETDLEFKLDFATGAKKTNRNIEITKINRQRTVLKKLNSNPALTEYIEKLGWNKEKFQDYKWSHITEKYPFAYYKNKKIILRTPLLILGEYMGLSTKIEEKDVFIAEITQEQMVDSVDEILTIDQPIFGFFTSCIARRDLMGIKIFQVQEKLKNYFDDKDFLLIFSAGEAIYKPDEGFYFLNETITSAIFKE